MDLMAGGLARGTQDDSARVIREDITERVHRSLISKKRYERVKRVLDVLISLVALGMLSPLFLILMAWIFICDPYGSPVYVSTRCGKGGVPFRFLKFRTMYVDAEQRFPAVQHLNEMDGPVFKNRNDPRIIPSLRFLRATSMDELLQFWHVLTGRMSVAGPRPPLPREIETYTPYQMLRLSVKPGLTCYWQTTPNRNGCTFDEWVEMDLKYIIERSTRVDAKLFFKTILVMLRKEGR